MGREVPFPSAPIVWYGVVQYVFIVYASIASIASIAGYILVWDTV